MSFTDPLGADQFVLDRLVQCRERETGDSRHLRRRISAIVWRSSTHQPLFYPGAGRILADVPASTERRFGGGIQHRHWPMRSAPQDWTIIRVARDTDEARGYRYKTRRGMMLVATKSKIAISLPVDQIARVHREVRAGRAGSVSGYIATVLAEQERRGVSARIAAGLDRATWRTVWAKDIKWAELALEQCGG